MVASLGVGGIAIAPAVQTLLSDIFASLSIGVDKPFEIGDFVVFGAVAGNIEHIGLKTTRIRALSGEQVVIANADLLRQIVHNYKRMNTRRIVFKFGITYNTPTEKVKEVAALVKRIIEGIEGGQVRSRAFHGVRRQPADLRSRLHHAGIGLQPVHGHPAGDQPALLEGLREMDVQFAFPTRSVEFIGGRLPEVSVAGVPQESGQPARRRCRKPTAWDPAQHLMNHPPQADGLRRHRVPRPLGRERLC